MREFRFELILLIVNLFLVWYAPRVGLFVTELGKTILVLFIFSVRYTLPESSISDQISRHPYRISESVAPDFEESLQRRNLSMGTRRKRNLIPIVLHHRHFQMAFVDGLMKSKGLDFCPKFLGYFDLINSHLNLFVQLFSI